MITVITPVINTHSDRSLKVDVTPVAGSSISASTTRTPRLRLRVSPSDEIPFACNVCSPIGIPDATSRLALKVPSAPTSTVPKNVGDENNQTSTKVPGANPCPLTSTYRLRVNVTTPSVDPASPFDLGISNPNVKSPPTICHPFVVGSITTGTGTPFNKA
jgi:hypothetical protein